MLATTNADARLPVGSLMKLLNAVVAYDAGQQDRRSSRPTVSPAATGSP